MPSAMLPDREVTHDSTQKRGLASCVLIDTPERLETLVSCRKQTMAALSNRYRSRPGSGAFSEQIRKSILGSQSEDAVWPTTPTSLARAGRRMGGLAKSRSTALAKQTAATRKKICV